MTIDKLDLLGSFAEDPRELGEMAALLALLNLFDMRGTPTLVTQFTPYQATRRQIAFKNRLDRRSAEEMPADEIVFGAWMLAYLGERADEGWTAGEAVDVLMDLGYVNHLRDFRANVHRLARRLHRARCKRHGPATWRDFLKAAAALGWYRRAEAVVYDCSPFGKRST